MADWRQVQARIRKAKSAADPAVQLTELYERTRDAMVAFELAALQEKAGDPAEAVRWYTSAAERFRRAQWRTKAEEALTRLGAPIPAPLSAASIAASQPATSTQEEKTEHQSAQAASEEAEAAGDSFGNKEAPAESAGAAQPADGAADGSGAARKRRHRGRRGGRRRRGEKSGTSSSTSPSAAAFPAGVASPTEISQPALSQSRPSESRTFGPSIVRSEPQSEPAPIREEHEVHAAPAAAPLWQGRARAGEPALASRIAQLESQLRRLLACGLASLDDADQAPAGPGVLLLSDSDQHTHYYIEACQTLRIGIGNLLRGGRGSKEAGRLKGCMAENLGIAEARVSKYLKDHCAVRWLQLDEGAPELAHFATAVLRPIVNE